jgi:hypothetical protein
MNRLSIRQHSGRKHRCLLLFLFGSLFTLVFGLTSWQPCQAQSVPLRIDTQFYKQKVPTPPKFGGPGLFEIRERVLPSGERIKQYVPTSTQLSTPPPSFAKGRGSYTPSSRQWSAPPPSFMQGGGSSYTPTSSQTSTPPPSFGGGPSGYSPGSIQR